MFKMVIRTLVLLFISLSYCLAEYGVEKEIERYEKLRVDLEFFKTNIQDQLNRLQKTIEEIEAKTMYLDQQQKEFSGRVNLMNSELEGVSVKVAVLEQTSKKMAHKTVDGDQQETQWGYESFHAGSRSKGGIGFLQKLANALGFNTKQQSEKSEGSDSKLSENSPQTESEQSLSDNEPEPLKPKQAKDSSTSEPTTTTPEPTTTTPEPTTTTPEPTTTTPEPTTTTPEPTITTPEPTTTTPEPTTTTPEPTTTTPEPTTTTPEPTTTTPEPTTTTTKGPKYPDSCADWCQQRRGVMKAEQQFKIDPEYTGHPWEVECDANGKTHMPAYVRTCSATILHHTYSEEKQCIDAMVDQCVGQQCKKFPITYRNTMDQIRSLINNSDACIQYISYECKNSPLKLKADVPNAAWYSRDGVQMNYWGGGSTPGMCKCGMSYYGCKNTAYDCNCDDLAQTVATDDGYLMDKATLPVTELGFGSDGHESRGCFKLGPLICYNR